MEIPLRVVLDEDDLQEALYHPAVLHNSERGRGVPYVDALAYPVADRHIFVPPPLVAAQVARLRARFRQPRLLATFLRQSRIRFRRPAIITAQQINIIILEIPRYRIDAEDLGSRILRPIFTKISFILRSILAFTRIRKRRILGGERF